MPDAGPVAWVAAGPADDPPTAARAWLIELAATALAVDPGRLSIAHDPAGRPTVEGPGAGDLTVSLSHAPGVAAAALAIRCRVGVDVEPLDPRRADLASVARLLDPADAAALRAEPPDGRVRAVALAWTGLEAEAKGRGVTLDRLRGRARTGVLTRLAIAGEAVGSVWTDRPAGISVVAGSSLVASVRPGTPDALPAPGGRPIGTTPSTAPWPPSRG